MPAPSGFVNDTAHLLSPATRQLLEQQLQRLAEEDSTQVVLLTIPSLGGESIEAYALRVAEAWQIGQQQFDNGVLLLVAKGDRKIRIEVGHGLEPVLTDLIAGRIIRTVMVPQFRRNRFDQGIIDGVGAIIGTVKGTFDVNLLEDKQGTDPLGWLIAALVGCFFLGRMFRKKKVVAAAAGALYGTVLALAAPFIEGVVLILLCTVGGMVGTVAASAFTRAATGRQSGKGVHFPGTLGDNNRRSGKTFGGGFSGGGGGFGGGGASGNW